MVDAKSASVTAAALLGILAINSDRADACTKSDLRGPVKSVIVSEAFVDPLTDRVAEIRLVSRTEVSKDGTVAETTTESTQLPSAPTSKVTAYFDNGRLIRAVETAPDGRILTSTSCSYDSQGRLLAANTQSANSERTIVENFEYAPGLIRRRAKTFAGLSLIIQTLDTAGRVVKEQLIDEMRSVVDHTAEYTYAENREEVCRVYSKDGRRYCTTTIRDSRGNEVEVRADGTNRKIAIEYDPVGNWVSKRTSIPGPSGKPLETIIRRRIEYWQ
jgi:hypothetical protein